MPHHRPPHWRARRVTHRAPRDVYCCSDVKFRAAASCVCIGGRFVRKTWNWSLRMSRRRRYARACSCRPCAAFAPVQASEFPLMWQAPPRVARYVAHAADVGCDGYPSAPDPVLTTAELPF